MPVKRREFHRVDDRGSADTVTNHEDKDEEDEELKVDQHPVHHHDLGARIHNLMILLKFVSQFKNTFRENRGNQLQYQLLRQKIKLLINSNTNHPHVELSNV